MAAGPHALNPPDTEPAPAAALPGWLRLWWALSAYFLGVAALQLAVSPTAEADQAEVLLLSQSLAWGYGPQPPLYNGLVWLVFRLLGGPSLLALLAVKVLLLSALAGCVLALAAALGLRRHRLAVALAGCALLPQLVWEAQRDLTHTLLCTVLAAATQLQLLRCWRGAGLWAHVGLGVLLAGGLLSKYNFALLIAAALLAAVVLPEARRAVRAQRGPLALAAAVALLLLWPHAHWVWQHLDLAGSGVRKLQAAGATPGVALAQAGLSLLAFAAPLLLCAAPWLWPRLTRLLRRVRLRRPGRSRSAPPSAGGGLDARGHGATPARRGASVPPVPAPATRHARRWLLAWSAACLAVLALLVLGTGAGQLRDRWLLPLLFGLPLLLALAAPRQPAVVSQGFVRIGLLAAGVAGLGLPGRVLLAEWTQTASRPNLPYRALLAQLPAADWVLADRQLLAGNARLHLPQARIAVPGFSPLAQAASGRVLVVCEAAACDRSGFRAWLAREHGIVLQRGGSDRSDSRGGADEAGVALLTTPGLVLQRAQAPYLHMPSRVLTLHWAWVQR